MRGCAAAAAAAGSAATTPTRCDPTHSPHPPPPPPRYPHRRPLSDLITLVQTGVGAVEEELKHITAAYSEKLSAQTALKRKRQGSLAQMPLEEVLTPAMLRGVEMLDSDHLLTLVACVGKAHEKAFLETYV